MAPSLKMCTWEILFRNSAVDLSYDLSIPTLVLGTVGKIYTPIFSVSLKKVVNIASLERGPVSNERSGIYEFFQASIFEKIMVFQSLFFSFQFTENFREMATTS